MGFFKGLAKLFSTSGKIEEMAYWVTVKCNRCGEVIRARVDLRNEVSLEYQEGGGASFFCRKVLMGEGRCFQRIEVELTFDANRNLASREISGGEFVEL